MKMLFQNKHFVIVDKESGWLTTPPRFAEKDSRPVLGLKLQNELGKKLFPVHRLDFEVSGVVMYALEANAHQAANNLFEKRKVHKTYQALTDVQAAEKFRVEAKLEWKCRILKGKKRSFESPHGKDSLTYATYKSEIDHAQWGRCGAWLLEPMTGRSHQLRFEMYRHECPILGDSLYGSKVKSQQVHSIALRAIELKILDNEFCQKFGLPSSVSVENPLF